MNSSHPELQILRNAVMQCIGKKDINSVERFDEATLLKLAKFHNLLPWLSLYADATQLGSEHFRSNLDRLFKLDRAVTQFQKREAASISAAMSNADIPHIVFKGNIVLQQFYKETMDTRYSDDIDILVQPADISRAYQLITEKGYHCHEPCNIKSLLNFIERYSHWYRWRDMSFVKQSQERKNIDLHWHIADDFTFPANTSSLLEQSIGVDINGIKVPGLPFSLSFVHVCVHGHLDYFFRLRYLVDVYAAMQCPEFDEADIMRGAKNYGVENKVIDAMATAQLFFAEQRPTHNAYADHVLQRFIDSQGLPHRSHPNQAEWTRKDRWQHFLHQINTRSRLSTWYTPLLARCKYDQKMAHSRPETIPPWLWYPAALIFRFLK